MTPSWYSITISINHFFLTMNRYAINNYIPEDYNYSLFFSSINFLIYCSVGDKFKSVVRKYFLQIGGKGEDTGDIEFRRIVIICVF